MRLAIACCAGTLALASVLLAAVARAAESAAAPGYELALVTGASQPRLWLAQRQIERSWGQSEDSVYKEIEIPGWRSEATSAALSALVPGAGQAYSGSRRAWVYMLAEVAGWTSRWFYARRGHDLQSDAASYVGSPADSASRWSFERWERATNGDATELRALFERDRNVFYDRIGRDPSLLDGWMGDPAATRTVYSDLRQHADDRLRYGRYAADGLWVNHVVSAVDALRMARLHNLSLGPRVKLGVRSGWSHGAPTFAVALRRSF